MDKRTRKVVDAALELPDVQRSELLHRMWAVLDDGPEKGVFDAALSLSGGGKWELVEHLLESLDGYDEDPIDRALREEIERREKALERGQARTVPWSEVREALQRARAEL